VNHKIILRDAQAPSKYFYLLRYCSQTTTSLWKAARKRKTVIVCIVLISEKHKSLSTSAVLWEFRLAQSLLFYFCINNSRQKITHFAETVLNFRANKISVREDKV